MHQRFSALRAWGYAWDWWLVGWCALSRPLVRRKTDRKRRMSSLWKFNLRIHCHKKRERERERERRCERSGRSELAICGIGCLNKLGWKAESVCSICVLCERIRGGREGGRVGISIERKTLFLRNYSLMWDDDYRAIMQARAKSRTMNIIHGPITLLFCTVFLMLVCFTQWLSKSSVLFLVGPRGAISRNPYPQYHDK